LIEIRFHGRGGQGAAIASSIIADAIFRMGKEVQSFPMFGVERRGAPVASFIRIDDKRIYVRCEVYEPDHVVVLDPTLIQAVDVTSGLKPGGILLVNSDLKAEQLGIKGNYKVLTFDGNSVAVEFGLGSKAQPIANTVMIGAFAKAFGQLDMNLLYDCIMESFPPYLAKKNADAAKKAFELAPSAN